MASQITTEALAQAMAEEEETKNKWVPISSSSWHCSPLEFRGPVHEVVLIVGPIGCVRIKRNFHEENQDLHRQREHIHCFHLQVTFAISDPTVSEVQQ